MTRDMSAKTEKGETILRLNNISKNFGAVSALTDIDLEVKAGEVVALVGDNGAGKSTLIKVLAGVHQQSSGTIEFMGSQVTLNSPGAALELDGFHLLLPHVAPVHEKLELGLLGTGVEGRGVLDRQ